MNLQTSYLGLSLRHPVIASASPLSSTLDGIRRLEDGGAAAIVAASVYEEEIAEEEAAFEAAGAIGAESHAEVTSYLPPLPGYRGALAAHVELIRRAAESVSVPLIASLNGTTHEGWTGIAALLQEAGAAALEVNFFHIPTDPQETSAEVEHRLIETVREVCAMVTIPVAVKLGANFTAPARLAVEIANAGARGLVLFGRCYEPDIDLETLTFRPSLRLSTAEEIRLPLMWIALLAGKTSLGLAAGRGVEGSEVVIKYLLAGADVVQVASSLLRHGPNHLNRLVEGLAEWIEAHAADSVEEIRGRLRADRLAEPEALLRASYVRTLLLDHPVRDIKSSVKIGVVGAGQVGATAAYAMTLRGVGSEIVLVDRKTDLAAAQAHDILDATPFAYPVRLRAGETADLDGAGIVVITAGVSQKPGESRLDLLSRNAEIFAEIVPTVLAAVPDIIFLVASNPVDIMTQIVTVLAARHGVPPERVIGSGTILDSARFRTLLAAHLGISPAYIDARVLGEHGDSEVLHWSGAMAADLSVAEAARQMGREPAEADRSRIDTAVRRAAYAIIQGKGATWFGVGAGIARMAQVIQDDERALITCSMLMVECQGVGDVALSLPRVLGAGGVVTTFMPNLDAGERAALKRSAEILKEAAEGVRL